ncbi:MAG TPA: rhodanese-like domain-containing protein [Gemmatimonadota bacterium]|nr:rhodanese-like domain-containing protein [Gemmatimonadota bacterium]
MSVRATQIAIENGYDRVAVLKGGLYSWRDAGYPVASGS